MAKKSTGTKKPALKKSTAKGKITTPVRNSAIPRVTAAAIKKQIEITSEMIAVRAFEIHVSGSGGSETDNWFAAEKQLRGSI